MTREIKLRAWIDRQKRYAGPVDIREIGRKWSQPVYWGVIEQYTGLKDKNGTEIYEGDIVLTVFGDKATVSFDRCWFGLEDYAGTDREGDKLLGNWLGTNLEVIGNVHENPELLNDG